MADSVDRVFGHALNTINKIRTGSQKPPVADRLALYGLYKQAMEGDVSYISTRPAGSSDSAKKEQEKWDAWHANRGLSRTEAKRRYIERLIQTMNVYATSTPEARELVSELEFVWDQVKGNSNSDESSGSSPARKAGYLSNGGAVNNKPLRSLDPESAADHDEEIDGGAEDDEFVDAVDSQYGAATPNAMMGELDKSGGGGGGGGAEHDSGNGRVPKRRPTTTPVVDARWRKRVEAALVKMTAEVAALRELVESRRYNAVRGRYSVLGWALAGGWFMVKLALVDALALWLVILYLRRKKDRRLEGAVRVMLGDAQAVAKNIAVQVGSKLPSRNHK